MDVGGLKSKGVSLRIVLVRTRSGRYPVLTVNNLLMQGGEMDHREFFGPNSRLFRSQSGFSLLPIVGPISIIVALMVLAAAIWAYCGRGGTGTPGGAGTVPGSATTSAGSWFSFSTTPILVGETPARFTAVVLDSNGRPVEGQTVEFRVTGDAEAAPGTDLVVDTGPSGAAFADAMAKPVEVVGTITSGTTTVTAKTALDGENLQIGKDAPVNNTVPSR